MARVTKVTLAHDKALAARDAQLKLLAAKVKALVKERNFVDLVLSALREIVPAMAPVKYPVRPAPRRTITTEVFEIGRAHV